jgi:hypothetical protein
MCVGFRTIAIFLLIEIVGQEGSTAEEKAGRSMIAADNISSQDRRIRASLVNDA